MTDARGRVVILHGLNQVYKVAPYTPSADGFGADDAAFLQRNGFDVVRVGVIWSAVEPHPGRYNHAYLDSIARTVRTLARHGIYALLDFHQDLYNEKFQGEGAPAWAVQDGGRPNPRSAFPATTSPTLPRTPRGTRSGTTHPGRTASGCRCTTPAPGRTSPPASRRTSTCSGYEVLNEPWPGTAWHPCITPTVGCPTFDQQLTAFYQRVATAIRQPRPHAHRLDRTERRLGRGRRQQRRRGARSASRLGLPRLLPAPRTSCSRAGCARNSTSRR